MKKFEVTHQITINVTIPVMATDEAEAIDKASDYYEQNAFHSGDGFTVSGAYFSDVENDDLEDEPHVEVVESRNG